MKMPRTRFVKCDKAVSFFEGAKKVQFNVSVAGIEGIDKEFAEFQKKLGSQVQKAMSAMEAPLKDDLFRHIEQDVYNAYKPKVYPRRRDNPEFGTALNDMDANVTFYNRGAGFTLQYAPSGEHSGTTADLPSSSPYYDADDPRPIKPNPVHGDELIRRIETGRGYDWNVYPGKRPFWQKFVNEEMDGQLAQHFAEAMRSQGVQDLTVDWSDVVREDGDGEY